MGEAITVLSGHLLKNDDKSPSFIGILKNQVAAKQTEETELAEAEGLVKSFLEQKRGRRSGFSGFPDLMQNLFQKQSRSNEKSAWFELVKEAGPKYFVRYMYISDSHDGKDSKKPIFSKKDYKIVEGKDYLNLYLKAKDQL